MADENFYEELALYLLEVMVQADEGGFYSSAWDALQELAEGV